MRKKESNKREGDRMYYDSGPHPSRAGTRSIIAYYKGNVSMPMRFIGIPGNTGLTLYPDNQLAAERSGKHFVDYRCVRRLEEKA